MKYKSYGWLDTQAKTLETKTLKRCGQSLSWVGIGVSRGMNKKRQKIMGIAVVLGSVIAGYAMAKGNFHVLFQPAEVVIIFGAAIGSLIISSPTKALKVIVGHLGGIFSDSHMNKAHYLELLLLMNAVF